MTNNESMNEVKISKDTFYKIINNKFHIVLNLEFGGVVKHINDKDR